MPVPATAKTEASLIEVFSSLQGEGILVGCRQIFVRLPHCNLSCDYCDTPYDLTDACSLEDPPGSGAMIRLPNPVDLEFLLQKTGEWCDHSPGAHHSFSFTGGEPLLHVDLLQDWLPRFRKLLPIYLETNGTLPDQLETLLPLLDWISMDIKLPSLTGQATDWQLQRSFLQTARRTNCYVKVVVAETTSDEELAQAAKLVSEVAPEVPFILQPVTIDNRVGLSSRRMLAQQELVAGYGLKVRVIPQTHIFLNLL